MSGQDGGLGVGAEAARGLLGQGRAGMEASEGGEKHIMVSRLSIYYLNHGLVQSHKDTYSPTWDSGD